MKGWDFVTRRLCTQRMSPRASFALMLNIVIPWALAAANPREPHATADVTNSPINRAQSSMVVAPRDPLPMSSSMMRFALVVIGGTYVAFQKKLLPKKVSRVAARVYFWPTLPITFGMRWGKLKTQMDETVMVGVAPVGLGISPAQLHTLGVRAVINLCDEYRGPVEEYARLGMEELWLPTVDHFEPSVSSLREAIEFIEGHRVKKHLVYVHCKAGHGRSAAVVFCWLFSRNPEANPAELADSMRRKRKVRKSLHLQPNVAAFRRECLRESRAGKNVPSS